VPTEARQQGPLGPTSTSMLMVHLTISASDDRLAALEKQIDSLTTLVRETKLTQRHSPSFPLQSTMPPARANRRCHNCGGDDRLWRNCPSPYAGQSATSSLINGQRWLLDSGTSRYTSSGGKAGAAVFRNYQRFALDGTFWKTKCDCTRSGNGTVGCTWDCWSSVACGCAACARDCRSIALCVGSCEHWLGSTFL
jgi:hypothetical protein